MCTHRSTKRVDALILVDFVSGLRDTHFVELGIIQQQVHCPPPSTKFQFWRGLKDIKSTRVIALKMAKQIQDLFKQGAPRGLGTGAKLLAASVAIGIGIHQSIYTGKEPCIDRLRLSILNIVRCIALYAMQSKEGIVRLSLAEFLECKTSCSLKASTSGKNKIKPLYMHTTSHE